MRHLAFFAFPLMLAAQTSESDRVTQALISEIQQLRLAIERSTLLGARTQIAVSQMQLQETAVARLTSQLDGVRTQGTSAAAQRARVTDQIQQLDQQRNAPENSAPDRKQRIERAIQQLKRELEVAASTEAARSAREGELAAQLQAAQAGIADSRARIAEMERALDAAIQQLLKK